MTLIKTNLVIVKLFKVSIKYLKCLNKLNFHKKKDF